MLRHALSAVIPDVAHGNAALAGGCQVDVVHARGCQANELQAGRGRHQRGVDAYLVGQHHFHAGNPRGYGCFGRVVVANKVRGHRLERAGIQPIAERGEVQKHSP